MDICILEKPSMTSIEIAELVGKRHDNVKRTIETLAESGVIVRPQIEDEPKIDVMGRSRLIQVFRFSDEQGKRDSIIVVAQLCPEFTARLVDRWRELEEQVRQPLTEIEMKPQWLQMQFSSKSGFMLLSQRLARSLKPSSKSRRATCQMATLATASWRRNAA